MKWALVFHQGSWLARHFHRPVTRRKVKYRSHIVLVCQENQGPWQMDHGCVEHGTCSIHTQ
jgi:hypothetical protein